MESELPQYISSRHTRKPRGVSKKPRTRRALKPNTTGIVYFLVMSHGSMFGKETGGKFELKMTKIPKKMKMFNKLTYALVGHPNWGTEEIEKKQIEEYTSRFAEFDEPGRMPLIGDDLKEFIQTFETYKPKMKILKDAVRDSGIYEVKPLIARPKSLFQVSLNNTYTDKIFMRNPTRDNETTDIFVVFAKGGAVGKQFEIGEQILKHRKPTTSYKIQGQVITLKELLNMSLIRGYNKVVMIDYSCETCYQIEDEHDAFSPSYEYVTIEDELPGRILEKMPYDPKPIYDKTFKEFDMDALEDQIYENQKELDKLEKQLKTASKSKIHKLEDKKRELIEITDQLQTQYDEKTNKLEIIWEKENNEWDEKYKSHLGQYQFAKPKEGIPIIDAKQILKLEKTLIRKNTRGGN